MVNASRGFITRRVALGLLTLGLVMTFGTAFAAMSTVGTYVTPKTNGAIKFTPLRAFRGGVEGKFVVGGKSYPGSEYAATGGGTGMVWYYGVSGIMAGNAVVKLQPDSTYSGPILFFDKKGNTTDSGVATVTFK